MGLDQTFFVSHNQLTNEELKGQSSLAGKILPILELRKHDQLQGYMEMLADRQGLIDLFEQDQTFDYERYEQAVQAAVNQLQDRLGKEEEIGGKHMVSTPHGNVTLEINTISETELDGKEAKRLQLGVVYPKQGRQGRFLDGFVRLGKSEVEELLRLIEASFEGTHQFPSCPGFFYGTTEEGDWELTQRFLSDMLEKLDWDHLCLLYGCSW